MREAVTANHGQEPNFLASGAIAANCVNRFAILFDARFRVDARDDQQSRGKLGAHDSLFAEFDPRQPMPGFHLVKKTKAWRTGGREVQIQLDSFIIIEQLPEASSQ